MITKEFHNEKTSQPVIDNIDTGKSHSDNEITRYESLAAIIMRLRLNSVIVDSDRQFIDSLPPDKSLAFIYKGQEYIHPQDVPLFDFELIETAIDQGGEAIFSHRFQASSPTGCGQLYKIYTVVLNPEEEDKIVFGFFGPEHLLSYPDHENLFFNLTVSMKRLHQEITALLPKIEKAFADNKAVLLINRNTQRVIAGNGQALKVYGNDLTGMTGDIFDNIIKSFYEKISCCKTQIENLNNDKLALSLMRFENDNAIDGHKAMTEEIIKNQLLHHSDKIQNAKKKLAENGSADKSEELRIIMEETDNICDLIRRASEITGR